MPPTTLAKGRTYTCYASGEVHRSTVYGLADGTFEVSFCREWFDSARNPDYEFESTFHATRSEAFAASGLSDPALVERRAAA